MRTVRFVWPKGQKRLSLIEATAGFAIQGLRRVSLSMEVDDVPRVEAEFYLVEKTYDIDIGDVECGARFFMRHPCDGDLREVSSITFADGSVVDL